MKGIVHTDNYIFHEIKDLKGKKELNPKDFEITENLTEIHEIKQVQNTKENKEQYISQTYNPTLKTTEKLEPDLTIYLEGDPASKNVFTTFTQKSKNNNEFYSSTQKSEKNYYGKNFGKKMGLCPNCDQNSQYNQEENYNNLNQVFAMIA